MVEIKLDQSQGWLRDNKDNSRRGDVGNGRIKMVEKPAEPSCFPFGSSDSRSAGSEANFSPETDLSSDPVSVNSISFPYNSLFPDLPPNDLTPVERRARKGSNLDVQKARQELEEEQRKSPRGEEHKIVIKGEKKGKEETIVKAKLTEVVPSTAKRIEVKREEKSRKEGENLRIRALRGAILSLTPLLASLSTPLAAAALSLDSLLPPTDEEINQAVLTALNEPQAVEVETGTFPPPPEEMERIYQQTLENLFSPENLRAEAEYQKRQEQKQETQLIAEAEQPQPDYNQPHGTGALDEKADLMKQEEQIQSAETETVSQAIHSAIKSVEQEEEEEEVLAQPQTADVIYQIQPGDTLSKIAEKYGVPLEQIVERNPVIQDPDLIRSGDTIVIPEAKVKGLEEMGRGGEIVKPTIFFEGFSSQEEVFAEEYVDYALRWLVEYYGSDFKFDSTRIKIIKSSEGNFTWENFDSEEERITITLISSIEDGDIMDFSDFVHEFIGHGLRLPTFNQAFEEGLAVWTEAMVVGEWWDGRSYNTPLKGYDDLNKPLLREQTFYGSWTELNAQNYILAGEAIRRLEEQYYQETGRKLVKDLTRAYLQYLEDNNLEGNSILTEEEFKNIVESFWHWEPFEEHNILFAKDLG
ncbi:MAG: LysM peptidoglycan-binding domain-containing protein [Candidatus Heimdallarchaeaceae archaeon]